MAILSSEKRRAWREQLAGTNAAWVLLALPKDTGARQEELPGFCGIADWFAHGQVSRLIQQGLLPEGDSCLIPGDPLRQRPSLLFLSLAEDACSGAMARIRGLEIRELSLAESTFPEDILRELKQTLKKEGIAFKPLEPAS